MEEKLHEAEVVRVRMEQSSHHRQMEHLKELRDNIGVCVCVCVCVRVGVWVCVDPVSQCVGIMVLSVTCGSAAACRSTEGDSERS